MCGGFLKSASDELVCLPSWVGGGRLSKQAKETLDPLKGSKSDPKAEPLNARLLDHSSCSSLCKTAEVGRSNMTPDHEP